MKEVSAYDDNHRSQNGICPTCFLYLFSISSAPELVQVFSFSLSLCVGGLALPPAGSNPLLLSLLLLFSVTCSYGNQNQQFINSCGDIHNISFPFQLQGDPSNTCNDENFTLSCDENNRTVLHLFSGKYYVKSIDYAAQSIRLVDVGFQSNDICSSFPPSSLIPSDHFDASPRWPWDVSSVVLLSCENPVQYPSIYINKTAYYNNENPVQYPRIYINKTGYCNSTRDNLGNGYYSYAVVGDVSIWDIPDSCFLEAFYLSSSPLVIERGSNFSWLDLNEVLEYGIEASWFNQFCSSTYCRKRASCFGDSVNVTAVCDKYNSLIFEQYCVPDSCPVVFFFIDRCFLSEIF
ncbi:uncharacterized protein LOC131321331 [Rhododendron vialii]|uniref:uncharacterized protein LOC131321331 n=1 Tax=Rhododendron vialii TaxID=182163 RepID=UPI00266005E9|nr:uncharacterized protein LOC131321331 [Rhododendron vialii]